MGVKYLVFTDASLRKGIRNRSYCGYGTAILNIETLQYTTISGELSPRSVVFCEAWAIYQGLITVAELANGKDTEVLVVSDSKLNVEILRRYIPYSWDLSDWEHWKKRDGSPVKNQDLYRRIVSLMRDHPEIKLRITHINSHLASEDWSKAKDKLKQYGVNVQEGTAKVFMKMNALADELAQDVTIRLKNLEARDGLHFRLIRKEDS